MTLRLVDPSEGAPITDDDAMRAEIHAHWKASQKLYAQLLRGIGDRRLTMLTSGGVTLNRYHFERIAETASAISDAAAAIADHMARSADAYDRRTKP
jgi:hypothetical protein